MPLGSPAAQRESVHRGAQQGESGRSDCGPEAGHRQRGHISRSRLVEYDLRPRGREDIPEVSYVHVSCHKLTVLTTDSSKERELHMLFNNA